MEALFKLWIGNKIKFVVFRNRRIGDRPSAYRILKYYDQERGVRVIPPLGNGTRYTPFIRTALWTIRCQMIVAVFLFFRSSDGWDGDSHLHIGSAVPDLFQ